MASGNQILTQLLFNIETNTSALKKGLDDAKSQFNGLQSTIKNIGGVIAGAFAIGSIITAGKAVYEFATEIGEATASVRDLTNLTGQELTNVTASIKATSDVFNTDFNETLKVTNALAHNYGISFEEASKLVQEGIALQDDDATQLLGLIKQFSPSFKTLGLSAQESFAIVSQAMDSGIIPETAIGAIGKATQNIREMNANARQALAAIGLNADEISLAIRNGTLTEYQAIQKVSAQMKLFRADSKEVGDTLMQVFGKAGVQAGAQFIESLSTMSTKWSEVLDQADDVEKANIRIAQAQTELNKELVNLFGESSTGIANLKASAYELAVTALKKVKEGVIDITNYFITLYNNALPFRFIVQSLILNFKTLWQIVKLFGSNLIDLFMSAGDLIKAVFTGNFKSIPAIYKEAMKKVVDNTKTFATESAQNFIDGYKAVMSKEKISLISKDNVEQQAKQASQTFAQNFNPSVHTDGKDKSGDKSSITKIDKNALIIPVKLKINPEDFTKINTRLSQVTKNIGYVSSGLEKVGKAFSENIKNQAIPAATQLGQQLGQMAASGVASFSDLANAALSSAKSIIAASLSQALAETIEANSAIPFPFSAIAIAAATAMVTAAFAAIPGFADGGVSQGGLTLVGERGAELISLPAGSRVYNNQDTNRMLSNNNGLHITLDSKIEGENLRFVLKNVERRRGNSSY